jgi:hypothetical protein
MHAEVDWFIVEPPAMLQAQQLPVRNLEVLIDDDRFVQFNPVQLSYRGDWKDFVPGSLLWLGWDGLCARNRMTVCNKTGERSCRLDPLFLLLPTVASLAANTNINKKSMPARLTKIQSRGQVSSVGLSHI